MQKLLDIVKVGTKFVMSGLVYTLTEDLGGGLFGWTDNRTPPASGTIFFDPDQTENDDMVVIE
jgi:hypothetical protein